MRFLNFYILVIFFVSLPFNLSAAPIKFFPAQLVQPNGDKINVFLSGDDYFNWVHDADNYTIIQDQKTGFYVYADLVNDNLVPTSFIVSKTDPKTTYLQSGLNISPRRMLELRNEFLRNSPDDMGRTPTTGTLNNLVVFIRFSGESEFTDLVSKYDNWFNNSTAGYNSMNNYFKEVSYNTLSIPSTFYPVNAGTTVISYQDSHVRGYYQPYSTTNTIGYQESERTTREHSLLVSAVNYISSQVPASLNLDGDNDGYVDNVCFIVYGSPTAWSTLLWPHRWSLYSYTVNINGKRVYDYNFQLQTHMAGSGVGVLCHEMFHSLGSPDLYHYSYDGLTTVGGWDLMENNANPPEHMGAFMKFKYGHWISSIPVISAGTYTLNPLTSSTGNCYRINSPNSSTDYYIVEYRRKTSTFENSIPGEGMLVYKINTLAGDGNADGPPDEVYIYRPGGTLTVNGTISNANFSSTVGRTSINDNTDPAPFLSNGNAGGISINSIGANGATITFTLGAAAPPLPVTTLAVINPTSNSLTLRWTVPTGITAYDIRYSSSPINDTIAFNSAAQLTFTGVIQPPGQLQSFLVNGLNFNTAYYYAIRTLNAIGTKSNLSNSASGTTWTAPHLSANPLIIQKTIQPSSTAADTITLSNTTLNPSTLDFSVSFQNSTLKNAFVEAKLLPVDNTSSVRSNAKGHDEEDVSGVSIKGQGGPDAFGYKWIDNNDPIGPAYVWEDITTTGTLAANWTSTGSFNAKDEGYTGPYSLGFNFSFYGSIKSQVYISSNGVILFNSPSSDIYNNATIPGSAVPNEFIAPFWDDLDGSSQGTVHYRQDGTRFIIQFTNWARYNQTSSLTFQVILYSNGTVKFFYNNMTGTFNSATVGIENATGTIGLQPAYNATYITNGLAVKISDKPDWLSSNVNNGTIYYGGSLHLVLTFNTQDIPLGTYSMNVLINSNDPLTPQLTIPVVLHVSTPLALTSFKALIQGLYNNGVMVPDTVTVELHSITSPYTLVDQVKILLDAAGTGSGQFFNAAGGNTYYVVLKHRNTIETWSAIGIASTLDSITYDFTTASGQAYGNNLINKGGKWCIYSGDVNQDGLVNTEDLNQIFVDNYAGASGLRPADLNGDQLVEIEDLNLVFINRVLGIQKISPAGLFLIKLMNK